MNRTPGNYFCVSTKDIWGAFIRFGTRNHWNHAGIFVPNGLVEAQSKGAVFVRGEKKYADSGDLITNAQDVLNFKKRTAIVQKAQELDGTPYGWLDIVWLTLYGTFGIKWGWLRKKVLREDRMICSQLVATCYAAAGITLVPGKLPQEVTPADLANRITRENGGN